jgi:diadenosine tetraphosphate (Ap4A) HIT family hydrolase
MNSLNKFCQCDCWGQFEDQPSDVIKIYDHWLLYLHFKQEFPGRCIVILKNHKTDLSELTNEEYVEFLKIYKEWEYAINEIAQPYNLHIIISNKESNIHKNHFHWHLIPRYDKPIKIDNLYFPYDSSDDKTCFYNELGRDLIFNRRDRGVISSKLREAIGM